MQRSAFKKAGVVLSAILIIALHFPLISANIRTFGAGMIKPAGVATLVADSASVAANSSSILSEATVLYEHMELAVLGLSKQTFDYAMKGFDNLVRSGKVENEHIISIADFSQPSSKKRLFVIDLDQEKVIFNTYVAHGVNSGKEMANDFSNQPESYKSSLGFYETQSTYSGGHGYSLRLEGLEKGINDNANRRDIVIHGAGYVNEGLIRSQGYIGRSWGCPALPENMYKPIINKIKDGTCLFIYSPDKTYLKRSKIINA